MSVWGNEGYNQELGAEQESSPGGLVQLGRSQNNHVLISYPEVSFP